MVLGRGFDPRVHINHLDGKEGPLDGEKMKIKTAKRGNSRQKHIKKNFDEKIVDFARKY
jgi:hypothetical protein